MSLSVELDSFVAECGGTFTGRVYRAPDADGLTSQSRARSVRLVLRFRTQGRGNTDKRDVWQVDYNLEPHGGLDQRFSLTVPAAGPVSYDGSMLRVLYEVRARVDLKLYKDETFDWPVLVVPRGGLGLYDRPHPLLGEGAP